MRRRAAALLLALALLALVPACDAGSDEAERAATDTTASATDAADTTDPAGGAGADAAAGADVASADQRFLTRMADHHEGLVLMAQRAQERAQDDSVSATADHLHRAQVAARDSLLALLSTTLRIEHAPQATRRHRAKADSITGLPIDDHDRYFLASVIAHHREGIAMIDLLGPSLDDARVREAAARLRASLVAAVAELESKRSALAAIDSRRP